MLHIYECYSSRTSHSWWIAHSSNANREVVTTLTSFYNDLTDRMFLLLKFAPGTTFTSWSQHRFVVIGKPEWQVHKASHCGRKYTGFNFSHYEMPFPYSRLYSVREVWFVSTCHSRQGISCVCVPLRPRKWPRFCIAFRFCPSAWTPRFQRVEFSIASTRTMLAVSAVAPS